MTHSLEITLELYKRKELSCFPLFEKQLQAIKLLEDDVTTEVLYGGGARSGKSWLGCCWQIIRRLSFNESSGLIARNEFSKLQVTTMVTFFKSAKFLGLKNKIDFNYNGQTHVVTFNNGSKIFFTEIKYIPSDPEFDRLGSYDLTDAFIDESQQIHSKAISVLKGRFSELSGQGWSTIPKALYTCNPARNWIYTDFVKPHKSGKLEPHKAFVPALVTDNPTVDQSYIDNLKRADKTTRERLLYGNFEYDDDKSSLVDFDAVIDLFTNDHVLSNRKDKHITADLAMQGRDKFYAMYWEGFVATIAIDKDYCTAKEIELNLKELKISQGVGNSKIIADSDGLGAYLESYIKNIKTFHANGRAVNKKEFSTIKDECGFKLAEMINNREIKILCSTDKVDYVTEEIVASLKRDHLFNDLSKKKLISKQKVKESINRSPDVFDNLLMRMLPVVKKSNRSRIGFQGG